MYTLGQTVYQVNTDTFYIFFSMQHEQKYELSVSWNHFQNWGQWKEPWIGIG